MSYKKQDFVKFWCDKQLAGKILRVKEIRKNKVNRVFLIETTLNKFLLKACRYSHEDFKPEKEKMIYELVSKKISCPRVILIDFSKEFFPNAVYLIVFIKGNHASDCINGKNRVKLIRELATVLKKINGFTFKSYGWIGSNGVYNGKNNWAEFYNDSISKKIAKICKDKECKNFGKKISTFFQSNKLPGDRPCLVHNDFRPENVLINSQRISGVLDFEWAFSGERLIDVVKAIRYFGFEGTDRLEFLNSYFKRKPKEFFDNEKVLNAFFDLEQLEFSVVYRAHRKIIRARLKNLLERMRD